MGFYSRVILPKICDAAMRSAFLEPLRERVMGAARGRVLEIGAGSGLNLRFYTRDTEKVVALEPDPNMRRIAEPRAAAAPRPVEFLDASAEQMPLEDASFDTVVTTWTLCTIPDGEAALGEMRRVLKPGGQLLFLEHGRSPEDGVRKWQDRVTPTWKCLCGGCHLNKPIKTMVEGAGFSIGRLDNFYMRGPKFLAYMYEGAATPA
jgi:ubiquinone/menaquinone biosynthesis C-methylase UbiE